MAKGIKVEGEGEWHARKHGGPKRRTRHWARTNGGQGSRRKIHLGIDKQTLGLKLNQIAPCHPDDGGDPPG